MARMFGFVGNRRDLAAHVLSLHRDLFRERRPPGTILGWGLGFYQSGEVLLRRRPVDERDVIDLAESAEDVRTDVLLGHVRWPSVGSPRTENTHPFRYRSWLFAHTGTLGGFERLRPRLLDSVPEFLRRNVRGETDSELLFYLVLSFLHDAGKLGDGDVEPAAVRDAIRAAVALVDRLSAEEGQAGNRHELLITNGEHMIAFHARGVMATRVLSGAHDVEELLAGHAGTVRVPNPEGTHCTLLVAELESVPPRFDEVPREALVTLRRDVGPEIERW